MSFATAGERWSALMRGGALLAGVLAGVSAAAWMLQPGAPGWAMSINSALALLAIAGALWWVLAGRRALALFCVLPGLGLPSAALLEAFVGVSSQSSEWLLHLLPVEVGATPMAPNTAAGLLLAALGVALAPPPGAPAARWALTWVCGCSAATIGALAALGHLSGWEVLAAWHQLRPMAPLTSIGLIVLGSALAGAGARVTQNHHTQWGPLLVSIAAVTTSLLVWHAVDAQLLHTRDALLQQHATGLRLAAEHGIDARVRSLSRMAHRIDQQPDGAHRLSAFRDNAAALLDDFDSLRGFEWQRPDAAPLQALRDGVQLAGAPAAPQRALHISPAFVDHAGRARQRVSVALPSAGAGVLAAEFDLTQLYSDLLAPLHPELPLQVQFGELTVFARGTPSGALQLRLPVAAGGGVELRVWAPAGPGATDRLMLALLLGGLVGSGLLGWALRLAAIGRARAQAAEAASLELQAQIRQRQRAESALSASQRQIADVLESVSDAVLMLDRDWRFIYINPHAEAMLRRRRRKLLGRVLWEAFPDAAASFRDAFEHALEAQQALTIERYYAPLQRWFEVRAYPHAHGLAVYYRDVTERRRHEDELRRSELLLETAGSSARLGGWEVEVGGERVRWTDEVCAIHEVPPGTSPTVDEAIAGYAPESQPIIRARFEACLRDGTPWDEELELITARGRRLWVHSIGKPFYAADGRIERVHGALQDISERKRAELLLREVAEQNALALERLQQVMDAAAEVICTVDADGLLTSMNPASIAVWGHAPDELIGTPIERLADPEDRAALTTALRGVRDGVQLLDLRSRSLTRDGRVIHMQWSASWSPRAGQICCIGRDRTAEHYAAQFETGQRAVLAAIAARRPLHACLRALAELYDAQHPGSHCAVWRLVDGTLRLAAAPNVPDPLQRQRDGLALAEHPLAAATPLEPLTIALPALADHGGPGLQAAWALPVIGSGGSRLALVEVFVAERRAPHRDEIQAIERIAALAAIAFEQADAGERLQRNSRRQQRLAEAGVSINRAIGDRDLQQQLSDGLCDIIGARLALLSLLSDDDWTMSAASLAPEYARWQGFALADGGDICALVAEQRQPLRLTQAALQAHPRLGRHGGRAGAHPPLRGLLAMPLIGGDEHCLGVLMLSDKIDGEFDADDEAIALQYAQLAATAIERGRLLERLRERDRFFDMSRELFCVFDLIEARYVQVNAAFVQLLGYSQQELTSRPVTDFIHVDDRERTMDLAASTNGQAQHINGFVNRLVCADGSVCWLEWVATFDGHRLFHAVARNITERRRIELERDYVASHDAATGLPHFPLLETALADMLGRGRPVSVLFIDLDHFHGINESMGHAVGDEALRWAALRMQAVLGEADCIARFAGDEFVALVPERDAAQTVALAQALRAAIAEPIEGDGYRLFLTASIGIAYGPVHGDDALELLRRAEAAMTRAKKHGRNGVCEFSAERMQELEDRRVLGSRLRDAIGSGELTLAFQPRLRARDRRLNGFEALARWHSVTLGPIPPDRFIPIAEALGLMPELGNWVLREACRQIRAWLEQGHRDFTVSVNVSAHQLQRPDLVDHVRAALAAEHIPPHMLELELTESALMENVSQVQTTLAQIKALGVALAIDDFGTGYSSLAYLKQFALDKLKIDRSFVTELPYDASDVAIARTIVAMAHQLKMVVAAEGVENEAQATFLRDIGCDELQGYLFGRPLPAAGAMAALAHDIAPA